jgi:hypothetical protein
MKFFITSVLILLSLVTILSNQAYYITYDIDDYNYNELIAESTDKWILMFYVPLCADCEMAINNLKKISMTDIMTEQPLNVKLGIVSCDKNSSYTCITYNINTVPYVVKINKGRMIAMTNYPSIESLNDFISSEHLESETNKVPEMIGTFEFIFKLREMVQLTNLSLYNGFKAFGINIEWEYGGIVGLYFEIVLILLGIEVAIIYCYCKRKKQGTPKKIIPENVESKAEEAKPMMEAEDDLNDETETKKENNHTKINDESQKHDNEEKSIIEKKNQ